MSMPEPYGDDMLVCEWGGQIEEPLEPQGGGFIAGYCWGNEAIGITPEIQDHACQAFAEYGTYR